jgi:hypothetical protein
VATRSQMRTPLTLGVTVVCITLTLALVITFSVAAWYQGVPENLHELGDAIAGFSAALAFIWLVGGYFLQQHELRETRHEYEQMRRNSEKQAELARRDDVVRGATIHLKALDAAVKSFECQMALLPEPVLGISPTQIPSMFSYGFLAKRCQFLESQQRADELAKLAVYVNAINREIRRYARAYLKLEDYLSSQQDGPWVHSILVEGSTYADAMRQINDASSVTGITATIFTYHQA